MNARIPYEYAVIRVVPDVARGEFVNAGVILYARQADFLGALTRTPETRLVALAPAVDLAHVRASLDAIGDCTPADGESIGQRFRWLTMPRSTVVQTSPIHTGLTADPAAELARLVAVLVDDPGTQHGDHPEG